MKLITADEARELCGFNKRVNDILEKISKVIRDCAADGARAVICPLYCPSEQVRVIANRLRQNGFEVYGDDGWVPQKSRLHILW